MKQVWQTYDGQIFDDVLDAQRHEERIIGKVRMWDRRGRATTDTANAMLVHLADTEAASIFLSMAHHNPSDDEDYCKGIEEDVYGWFYWDEGLEEYRWLDDELISAIQKCASEKS
jgi:hypothetical protein